MKRVKSLIDTLNTMNKRATPAPWLYTERVFLNHEDIILTRALRNSWPLLALIAQEALWAVNGEGDPVEKLQNLGRIIKEVEFRLQPVEMSEDESSTQTV